MAFVSRQFTDANGDLLATFEVDEDGDIWVKHEYNEARVFVTKYQFDQFLARRAEMVRLAQDVPATGDADAVADAMEKVAGAVISRTQDFVTVTMPVGLAQDVGGLVEFAARRGMDWSCLPADGEARWLQSESNMERGRAECMDQVHAVGGALCEVADRG